MSQVSFLGGRRKFRDEDEAVFLGGVRFAPSEREMVAYVECKQRSFPDDDDVLPFVTFPTTIAEIDPTEVKERCAWHSNQNAYYFFCLKKRDEGPGVNRKAIGNIWTEGNVLFGQKIKVTFKGKDLPIRWRDWVVEEVQKPYSTQPTECWVMIKAWHLVELYGKPNLEYKLGEPPGPVEGHNGEQQIQQQQIQQQQIQQQQIQQHAVGGQNIQQHLTALQHGLMIDDVVLENEVQNYGAYFEEGFPEFHISQLLEGWQEWDGAIFDGYVGREGHNEGHADAGFD